MNRFVPLDRLEELREARADDSIQEYVVKRSIGAICPTRARQAARRQYVNVVPYATIYEQELPAHVKKFSPSGKVTTPLAVIRTHSWFHVVFGGIRP